MSGDMQPYVVRQGDYLVKLAWVHGFDAEEVWADEKPTRRTRRWQTCGRTTTRR
jgi:hypothetical protein